MNLTAHFGFLGLSDQCPVFSVLCLWGELREMRHCTDYSIGIFFSVGATLSA
jgi:hypothetical protein